MSHYIYMHSYKQRTSLMNTTENNEQNPRPFGYWLKAVDRLMAAEFATAFESFGVTRRDWRMLNRVASTVEPDARPLPVHKLSRLIELGWVTDADGSWALTDEGRDAKERLGGIVEGIRAKVADAVPAEDLATTIATLEQLARAFGWDENTPLPRGGGHRHGFGRHGFGRHGFGPRGFEHEHAGHGAPDFEGRGFDERGECRHDRHPFAHGEGRGHHGHTPHGSYGHAGHCHNGHGHNGRDHGGARFARFARGAYERGFEAGLSRGRDDR